MPGTSKTALIVGASRGLGLGLAGAYLDRGWDVVATTRGRNDDALREREKTAEGRLRIETLDVGDMNAIDALSRALGATRLDILFVSAGMSLEAHGPVAQVAPEAFAQLMLVNALAPLKIIEALGGCVPHDGAIVAMTSILGSVAENTSGGYEAYRASKAALNTLLRCYAARHKQRAVLAMHPGWVRTDMGGPNAALSVGDSVTGMVDVIAAHLGKPGCVFLDYRGRTIAW